MFISGQWRGDACVLWSTVQLCTKDSVTPAACGGTPRPLGSVKCQSYEDTLHDPAHMRSGGGHGLEGGEQRWTGRSQSGSVPAERGLEVARLHRSMSVLSALHCALQLD